MIGSVFSLFAVFQLTSSLTVDIPQLSYELARGDDATLPCIFTPGKPISTTVTITWMQQNPGDTNIEILTYYYSTTSPPSLDIMDDFTNRADLQVDIPKGSAILTLKSLTSKDSRVFECIVKIPGDKGKSSDTTSVVVLVAPTKPICAVQGKAEYYQNINLTCRSEEGTPTPTYKWQSYDVNNNPRANPPKATDVNGVLSLYNISMETSGYYICTSANKIRSESCNLTLTVMPFSMNIGSTAGIIGGCVAGVLLLIVAVCCCRRCRKKKANEEYAMGYAAEPGEYTDKEPQELEEQQDKRLESKAEVLDDRVERSDHFDDPRDYEARQKKPDNRQYDPERYDDRRSDYDDRRSDRSSEPRGRNDDRPRNRYADRYDDRRDRYDHPDDRYDDRRDRYDHPDDRYNDRQDRYDHPDDRYDDRRDRYDRSRPPNLPNKPTRG
ncbi:glycoprotein A33 (transmembrane), paralog a [Tachysurus fulvidraco]|uniref:glycoprotein A33 (transmembrane), paralog a n=1 Tax=Tachysurus fulvidraco TaxID=1234273 RepID=UPI001FF04645|nr:glycoprotein A33 (transmembrane), paralog a [Tachysurus fulvidraco]